MKLTLDDIRDIILNNPNKQLIADARIVASKLMLHVLGMDLQDAIKQNPYFESAEVFHERKKSAISNKDMLARLLQREAMVFTAQGGACFYAGLDDAQTLRLNATLDSIRFGMTVRKWVQEFALKAYRCDPMGVIFIEADKQKNVYPTYKSIAGIYDYLPNGRSLEYICFKLTAGEAIYFGVQDETLAKLKPSDDTPYYRIIDDAFDSIFKADNETVTEAVKSIKNIWAKVPGVMASNIIDFNNTSRHLSPLDECVELADEFLHDRSVRNIFKKFSGFPKPYEPLLDCGLCEGTGFFSGRSCPECTPNGSDKGAGKKLRTKVADIARFPIDKDMPDISKYFGYVSPPKDTWDKMDTSLGDIENTIRDVYWGSYSRISTTGPTAGESFEETATKTLSDLQPIYARLNLTADWAESTENAICDFIGAYMFPSFKKSTRTYGRYYILETPDELMEEYLEMKQKGAPQLSLFDTLRKYYHSLYATNQVQLAIKLKLINVEPFVHQSVAQVMSANPSKIDFYSKMYFSEWLAAKDDNYLLATPEAALLADLQKYAKEKIVEPQDLLTPPTVGISETIKNTN